MTPPRDPQAFERELLTQLRRLGPLTATNMGEALIRARARECCGAAQEVRDKYPRDPSTENFARTLETRAEHWRARADGWAAFVEKEGRG